MMVDPPIPKREAETRSRVGLTDTTERTLNKINPRAAYQLLARSTIILMAAQSCRFTVCGVIRPIKLPLCRNPVALRGFSI